jgi:hypothetical protein
MTATRLGPVRAQEAGGLTRDQPVIVARWRPPALAVRFGIAVVAVAAAAVGWVLFGDTDPAIWTYGYWPVRELMSAAIAFSIGGAVLLAEPITVRLLLSSVAILGGIALTIHKKN